MPPHLRRMTFPTTQVTIFRAAFPSPFPTAAAQRPVAHMDCYGRLRATSAPGRRAWPGATDRHPRPAFGGRGPGVGAARLCNGSAPPGRHRSRFNGIHSTRRRNTHLCDRARSTESPTNGIDPELSPALELDDLVGSDGDARLGSQPSRCSRRTLRISISSSSPSTPEPTGRPTTTTARGSSGWPARAGCSCLRGAERDERIPAGGDRGDHRRRLGGGRRSVGQSPVPADAAGSPCGRLLVAKAVVAGLVIWACTTLVSLAAWSGGSSCSEHIQSSFPAWLASPAASASTGAPAAPRRHRHGLRRLRLHRPARPGHAVLNTDEHRHQRHRAPPWGCTSSRKYSTASASWARSAMPSPPTTSAPRGTCSSRTAIRPTCSSASPCRSRTCWYSEPSPSPGSGARTSGHEIERIAGSTTA